MKKYIFTQDSNIRPIGSSNLGVNFKKGDIIEGIRVRNTKSSEPPSFIEAITPQGKINIGYGGRAGSVVELYNDVAFKPNQIVAFKPNPKAVDCAKKVGLPSWYTQDPMLPRPQVVIDPSLIKEFNDCMKSSSSMSESEINKGSTTTNQTNKDLSTKQKSSLTTKNILIGILVIGSVVGFLKWKKII